MGLKEGYELRGEGPRVLGILGHLNERPTVGRLNETPRTDPPPRRALTALQALGAEWGVNHNTFSWGLKYFLIIALCIILIICFTASAK